jgi:tetratricopeptide (TPR) repeat protein
MRLPYLAVALLAVLAAQAAAAPGASAHDREAAACWAGLVQGKAAAARQACVKAAALGGKHDLADLVRLGHLKALDGQRENARAVYRMALGRDASEEVWRRGPGRDLEKLVAQGGPQAACWREAQRWLRDGRQALARANADLAQAQTLTKARQLDEALPLARRAFDVLDPVVSLDAKARSRVLNQLMYLQEQTFHYDELLAFSRQQLARVQAQGDHDDDLKDVYINGEAAALQGMGRYIEAAGAWQRAVEIAERADGRDDPGLLWMLNAQAECLLEAEDDEGAWPVLERAVGLLRSPKAPLRAASVTVALLARSLQAEEQGEEALVAARAALALAEQVTNEEPAAPVPVLAELADVLSAQGELTEAIEVNRRAQELAERTLGPIHPMSVRRLERLALALADDEQFEAAQPLLQRAYDVAVLTLGPDHPETRHRRALLAELAEATSSSPPPSASSRDT